jgi:hypothetical protein
MRRFGATLIAVLAITASTALATSVDWKPSRNEPNAQIQVTIAGAPDFSGTGMRCRRGEI